MPYPSRALLAAARGEGSQPIPLSSLQEAKVLVPLAANPHRPEKPRFVVIKLERMRDALEMFQILYEYAKDGSIDAINLPQVQEASKLDRLLVQMKHNLVDMLPPLTMVVGLSEDGPEQYDPAPDRGDYDAGLIQYLNTPRVVFLLDEARVKIGEICRAVEICCGGLKSKISRAVSKGINKLRGGEAKEEEEEVKDEISEIKELQALAGSLLDPDVKGVVPREALREIQLDACTTLYCLQQLQVQHIPCCLAKIEKRRNKELVMPHPLTPRPRLLYY